jgi:hypothetical protein
MQKSIKSTVIIKKLYRIDKVSKHTEKFILELANGQKIIKPVFKIPPKKTVHDKRDELTSVLNRLNVKFEVSTHKGIINTIYNVKTHIK